MSCMRIFGLYKLTPPQQATTINPHLASFNLVWDRIQLVVFFVQETALSILYIFQTRKYLKGRAPLRQRAWSAPSTVHGARQTSEEASVLWQLVWANTLIIALDITLLGIQCANLFHLQGAFKPCVYGIKLKLEFVILNRLISTVRQPTSDVFYSGSSGSAARAHAAADAATPQLRGNSLWQKTDSGEETTTGMQLEPSRSRSEARDHSVGSETPIYHGTEAG